MSLIIKNTQLNSHSVLQLDISEGISFHQTRQIAIHYFCLISTQSFLRCVIKCLTQMKKFLVKLMNQLPNFLAQSIDQYDGLVRSVMNSFSFFSFFSLTCFLDSFLGFFWMLRMLVTVHKPCNVPHTPPIKTQRTISPEIFFGASKE